MIDSLLDPPEENLPEQWSTEKCAETLAENFLSKRNLQWLEKVYNKFSLDAEYDNAGLITSLIFQVLTHQDVMQTDTARLMLNSVCYELAVGNEGEITQEFTYPESDEDY